MILTCPECATGYFVDDGQVGPSGRKVRCAACGARWTAQPAAAALAAVPTEEPEAEAMPLAPGEDGAPLGGDELPRAYRSRAQEEKRLRHAAFAGAAWAAAGVAVALLAGAAVLFRDAVVRAWPPTASVYASLGLSVNPVGLVIEQVRAEPTLADGHAVLAVSGAIRNVVDRPVTAPPLRITLLDAQGKRVAGQIDRLSNARIPPGETRHFLTAIYDPPMSENDLTVEFAIGARLPPGRTAPTNPAFAAGPTITLRGPAPNAAVAQTISTTPAPPPAAAPLAAPPSRRPATPQMPTPATAPAAAPAAQEMVATPLANSAPAARD